MNKRVIAGAMAAMTLGFFACHQAPKDSYTINGDITGLKDSMIYFRTSAGDSMVVDSAKVTAGKFTFTGKAEEPKMASIYLQDRRGGFNLYVENAAISIKGNVDSLSTVRITGSPTQEQWDKFQADLKPLNDQEDTLFQQYQTARMKNDTAAVAAIEKQANDLNDKREAASKKFIQANPKSYISLNLLRSLVYSTEYADLNKMFTGLDTAIQHSATGAKISEQLDKMKATAIGEPAIDFTANDVNGNPVSLSSFKGKYVLVDFWASWCGPCRAENPNVVKAFNKYKDKNFTILGVSLDEDASKWKEAIDHDKLAWTQVSDLKGWKSEPAGKYGVRAIPANFLLDQDGKIIGHNLRGEDLEAKLAEILK
ncbi:Peroxiredoxin [Arachidicoccus rhizosphaerae]|uniref:Peroxiredoxin n=1 Tax=Arachidicoccus rhizosphaerae TaxID=551991 RepID=A0A1H4CY41_9BACT|nr:TlpA disulfide reductase family protein [Arachidicoccus rhizosphaerae]SEA65139.1 Peroxiredoxin [Arachidicoccus rhizosphaerae]